MMRSPRYMAIALRLPNGTIVIREQLWKGLAERFPILKKPLLRGVAVLVESMANGVEALGYSADRAVQADAPTGAEAKGLSTWEVAGSMALAFTFGIALFVALPHALTYFIGKAGLFQNGTDNPLFHLIDGTIKATILVAYISLISLMKDIKRVFQYHGAEHKSIHAFEKGEDLIVANARRHPTMHPRCGTSFLLFLVLTSIVIFSAAFPLFGINPKTGHVFLDQTLLILVKIVLMFPVAAVSYEVIRFSGNNMGNVLVRTMIAPGLWLQKLTTKEPDDQQLEIALASLRRVLLLEKDPAQLSKDELSFKAATDIASVQATVAEFRD
jgi:uncharacterized protein YqhQ